MWTSPFTISDQVSRPNLYLKMTHKKFTRINENSIKFHKKIPSYVAVTFHHFWSSFKKIHEHFHLGSCPRSLIPKFSHIYICFFGIFLDISLIIISESFVPILNPNLCHNLWVDPPYHIVYLFVCTFRISGGNVNLSIPLDKQTACQLAVLLAGLVSHADIFPFLLRIPKYCKTLKVCRFPNLGENKVCAKFSRTSSIRQN